MTADKHIPYFVVLEALQTARLCALCELEDRDVRRYLDGVLYEHVNDPHVRRQLVAAKGYCRRHAHLLVSRGDGLGVAILYEDQARLAVELLSKSACAEALQKALRKTGCPACKFQAQVRDAHVSVLAAGLAQPEMRRAFETSPGLCLPHSALVMNRIGQTDTHAHFVDVERRKFAELLVDLQTFVKRCDYRSDKRFGNEADSWMRVVSMLCGMRDVFD